MLAKKTSKNQLTLPKEVAEKFPGTTTSTCGSKEG